ncbi:MAG: septum formation protein Maf [Deltaproteobacteria bacterium]|nr:septum formation protein Maf [Deltaproteobacteria bacterium]
MDLILASASPRRQQMLRDLGVSFKIHSPDIDEGRLRGEPASVYVSRLAREKAECIVAKTRKTPESGDWAVLAADTVVIYEKLVLGKPNDVEDAVRMLRRLSGRTHEVVTAFYWSGARGGKVRAAAGHARTKVTFADMPVEFWKWYVSTGEPMDKAGAYAAQGIGMSFIERVSGSYANVVGLPLSQVLASFRKIFDGDLREHCAATK